MVKAMTRTVLLFSVLHEILSAQKCKVSFNFLQKEKHNPSISMQVDEQSSGQLCQFRCVCERENLFTRSSSQYRNLKVSCCASSGVCVLYLTPCLKSTLQCNAIASERYERLLGSFVALNHNALWLCNVCVISPYIYKSRVQIVCTRAWDITSTQTQTDVL